MQCSSVRLRLCDWVLCLRFWAHRMLLHTQPSSCCQRATSILSHTCSKHNRSTTMLDRWDTGLRLRSCSFFYSRYSLCIILIEVVFSFISPQNFMFLFLPGLCILRWILWGYPHEFFSWSLTRKHVYLHPGEHSWLAMHVKNVLPLISQKGFFAVLRGPQSDRQLYLKVNGNSELCLLWGKWCAEVSNYFWILASVGTVC